MVRRLHYLYVEADLTLLAQCYWGTLAYQNVHDALFRRHHCLVTAGDKAAQLKVCDSQNAVQTPVRQTLQSRSLYGLHVSTSFLDPVFGAMMKQACRQTLKSLAAECLVGVRLGLLNFLTPVCVD